MRLSFEGDWDAAWSFLPEAEQELFSLKQRMGALGQTQGSFHATFANGEAYAYGYVLPTGMEAIHIVTSPGRADETTYDFVDPTTPDFLSGYLINGNLVEVNGETRVKDFRPSQSCVSLHRDEVKAGSNRVRRIAITPGDVAGVDSGAAVAQAAVIRPTMYSGTMKKVIQFLLGLGKQFANQSIYDVVDPPLPDEMIDLATDERDDGDDETPYESTVKSQGVRIQYDHRFFRTHGLTRAQDGKWWVVEISSGRGVLMMRLPLCRHTDLEEFRQKCETLGDAEALGVLDLFRGFPSGEPFPSDTKAIDAAVRSGRILRPKTSDELKDYFRLNGYSSVMGWAFNESGSEAHNTAYDYDNAGYAVGSHWAMQFSIGPLSEVAPASSAEELKSALGPAESLRTRELFAEVMWKIDRLTPDQVAGFLEMTNSSPPEDVFDAVDALTLSPPASASCSLSKVSEGYLWTRALYGPQMKFPEPILRGLISAPLYQPNGALPAVACHTTVHVFFIGEELKWAKYYSVPEKFGTYVVEDTLTGKEDVAVGDLYYERHNGPFGVAPGFYTNDFDDRKERGSSIYTERHKRRFAGYYETLTLSHGSGDRTADYVDRGFDPPIPWLNMVIPPLTVWRMAKFAWEKWTTGRNADLTRASVTVPMQDRCAYFYTIEHGNAGGMDTYLFRYEPVGDPNIGYYNSPFAFGDDTIQGTSKTFSVGSQRWPNHQERIDAADHGEWVPIGADVKTIVTNEQISLGWYTKSTSKLVDPHFSLNCTLICANDSSPVSVFSREKTGSNFYPTRWFMISPDPETGQVDVIHETHNALGEATALVYSDDINSAKKLIKGKPSDDVLKTVVPTFIGPFDA